MPHDESRFTWVSGDDDIKAESEAAWTGDNLAAERLLRDFAATVDDPENVNRALVAHFVRCVAEWAESDFKPSEARRAFKIAGKRGRPSEGTIVAERNKLALTEYAEARADGLAHDAAILHACAKTSVSESAMRNVYVRNSELRDFLVLFAQRMRTSKMDKSESRLD